ncbi:MAG: endonuclease/exonuclease/phosphatase family protein [Spartobacteria bacterium]
MSPRGIFCWILFFCLPLLPAKEVVVAYYNLENYLPMPRVVDGKRVENAPKPESEIAALIAMLKRIRPDVLGVVEIGDQAMLADFQARLSAVGMDFPHAERVASPEGGRHIALLSRFPIVARNSRPDVAFELDGRHQRMGRGILDATVEITPDYQLRLVGVHLKSRRVVSAFDEKKFRAREALLVRAHLDAILKADSSVNLLLFGDLNDTKNESPIKDIQGIPGSRTAMRDLPLRDAQGLVWTHFWQEADVYSRIDYLLASPGLWPELNHTRSGIGGGREWRRASDHRPLYTTLRTSE